jgi:predicted RNase H-like HicB family nuclease
MNNIKYEITIYWSETDGVFIAEVPELAGCMADGETYNEALANAQIVVNQWIETANLLNRAVPKPKNRFSFA